MNRTIRYILHSVVSFVFVIAMTHVSQLSAQPLIITEDIDRFWAAYDKIAASRDSATQYHLINSIFIDAGTPGLKKIMEARRYTDRSYIEAINKYPLFWASQRANTLRAPVFAAEIGQGIEKLRVVYPALRPAKIYFTIGAFRTPGTILDGDVLIGSEMALGDQRTITSEFPPELDYFKNYLATDPSKEVVFLNIHEYVHTQQNARGGYDLLSQCLYEGVAEFIPAIALGQASPTPAVAFGKANEKAVKQAFSKEMFSPWEYNWVWNDTDNQFKTRDLGYYIGYAIAEKYYQMMPDKKQAIKDLIELDYTSQAAVENLVEKTAWFDISMKKLKKNYEKRRPKITGIKDFTNGAIDVSPGLTSLTFTFSEPMDIRFRSTDLGPLGKDYCPEITSIAFSDDGLSVTYYLKLQPDEQYQFILAEGYRNAQAAPLVPYLLEFRTGK